MDQSQKVTILEIALKISLNLNVNLFLIKMRLTDFCHILFHLMLQPVHDLVEINENLLFSFKYSNCCVDILHVMFPHPSHTKIKYIQLKSIRIPKHDKSHQMQPVKCEF